MNLTVVLPAKNEAPSLDSLLPRIKTAVPNAEILVVDDGSTDDTPSVCSRHGVRVVSHPYSKGNGAAVKSGARSAKGDVLLLMDADGQHNPDDIPQLLEYLERGYDMIVGARDRSSQASTFRGLANRIYNTLSSWVTGHSIRDLTSGFRIVRADKFQQFLYMLPNGFSYPTTITMAFLRAGYSVAYAPIQALPRQGKSHIHPIRDGLRFLLIIFRVGTLYSPLKVFVPTSFLFFLIGASYYLYTYITEGRFTNMSALLFITSILVFLMGLISEQIANLLYANTSR